MSDLPPLVPTLRYAPFRMVFAPSRQRGAKVKAARGGRSRPIFDPARAEFRAEPVRTTLRAALRRRPHAAPRARALSPLRNCVLAGPSLSHLSLPRTPNQVA